MEARGEEDFRRFMDIFWEFPSADRATRQEAAVRLVCYLIQKQTLFEQKQQLKEKEKEEKTKEEGKKREKKRGEKKQGEKEEKKEKKEEENESENEKEKEGRRTTPETHHHSQGEERRSTKRVLQNLQEQHPLADPLKKKEEAKKRGGCSNENSEEADDEEDDEDEKEISFHLCVPKEERSTQKKKKRRRSQTSAENEITKTDRETSFLSSEQKQDIEEETAEEASASFTEQMKKKIHGGGKTKHCLLKSLESLSSKQKKKKHATHSTADEEKTLAGNKRSREGGAITVLESEAQNGEKEEEREEDKEEEKEKEKEGEKEEERKGEKYDVSEDREPQHNKKKKKKKKHVELILVHHTGSSEENRVVTKENEEEEQEKEEEEKERDLQKGERTRKIKRRKEKKKQPEEYKGQDIMTENQQPINGHAKPNKQQRGEEVEKKEKKKKQLQPQQQQQQEEKEEEEEEEKEKEKEKEKKQRQQQKQRQEEQTREPHHYHHHQQQHQYQHQHQHRQSSNVGVMSSTNEENEKGKGKHSRNEEEGIVENKTSFKNKKRSFSFSLATSSSQTKNCSSSSSSSSSCCPELDYAACRLVSGLASPRGCVRQGYATALLLVLRQFPHAISSVKLLDAIEKNFSIQQNKNIPFSEIKDLLLGRLFALAVLQKIRFFPSPLALIDKNNNKKNAAATAIRLLFNIMDEKLYLQDAAVFLLRLIIADVITQSDGFLGVVEVLAPRLEALERFCMQHRGTTAAASATGASRSSSSATSAVNGAIIVASAPTPATSTGASHAYSTLRRDGKDARIQRPPESQASTSLLGKIPVGGLPCSLAALQLHVRADLFKHTQGLLLLPRSKGEDAEENVTEDRQEKHTYKKKGKKEPKEKKKNNNNNREMQHQNLSQTPRSACESDTCKRAAIQNESPHRDAAEASRLLLTPDLLSAPYRPLLLKLLRDSIAFHPLLHSIWSACLQLLIHSPLHVRPAKKFVAWWEAVDDLLFGGGMRLLGAAAAGADEEDEVSHSKKGGLLRGQQMYEETASTFSPASPPTRNACKEEEEELGGRQKQFLWQEGRDSKKRKKHACTLQQEFLGLRVVLEVLLHLKSRALHAQKSDKHTLLRHNGAATLSSTLKTNKNEEEENKKKKQKKRKRRKSPGESDGTEEAATSSTPSTRKTAALAPYSTLNSSFKDISEKRETNEETDMEQGQEANGNEEVEQEENARGTHNYYGGKGRAVTPEEALQLFAAVWTHGTNFTRCLWKHLQAGKTSPLLPVVHAFMQQLRYILEGQKEEFAADVCRAADTMVSSSPSFSSNLSNSSSSSLLPEKQNDISAVEATGAAGGGPPQKRTQLRTVSRRRGDLSPTHTKKQQNKTAEIFDSLLQHLARDKEVSRCYSHISSAAKHAEEEETSLHLLRTASLSLPLFCRREILLAFARAANFTPLKKSFSTTLVRLWFPDVLRGEVPVTSVLMTFLPSPASAFSPASEVASNSSPAKPTKRSKICANAASLERRRTARELKLAAPWLTDILLTILHLTATVPFPSRPLCISAPGTFFGSTNPSPPGSSPATGFERTAPSSADGTSSVCVATCQQQHFSAEIPPSFPLFTSVLISVILSASLHFRAATAQHGCLDALERARPSCAATLPAAVLASSSTLMASVAATLERTRSPSSARESHKKNAHVAGGNPWDLSLSCLQEQDLREQRRQPIPPPASKTAGGCVLRHPPSIHSQRMPSSSPQDGDKAQQTLPPAVFVVTEKQELGIQCAAKLCETLLVYLFKETADITKRWGRACACSGNGEVILTAPPFNHHEVQGDSTKKPEDKLCRTVETSFPVRDTSDVQRKKAPDEAGNAEAQAALKAKKETMAREGERTPAAPTASVQKAAAKRLAAGGMGLTREVTGADKDSADIVVECMCRSTRDNAGDDSFPRLSTRSYFIHSLVSIHFFLFKTFQAAGVAACAAASRCRGTLFRSGEICTERAQQQERKERKGVEGCSDNSSVAARTEPKDKLDAGFSFIAMAPPCETSCVPVVGDFLHVKEVRRPQEKRGWWPIAVQGELSKKTRHLLKQVTTNHLSSYVGHAYPYPMNFQERSEEEEEGIELDDMADGIRHERKRGNSHKPQHNGKREFVYASSAGDAENDDRGGTCDTITEEDIGGPEQDVGGLLRLALESAIVAGEIMYCLEEFPPRPRGAETLQQKKRESCSCPTAPAAGACGAAPVLLKKQQPLKVIRSHNTQQPVNKADRKKSKHALSTQQEERPAKRCPGEIEMQDAGAVIAAGEGVAAADVSAKTVDAEASRVPAARIPARETEVSYEGDVGPSRTYSGGSSKGHVRVNIVEFGGAAAAAQMLAAALVTLGLYPYFLITDTNVRTEWRGERGAVRTALSEYDGVLSAAEKEEEHSEESEKEEVQGTPRPHANGQQRRRDKGGRVSFTSQRRPGNANYSSATAENSKNVLLVPNNTKGRKWMGVAFDQLEAAVELADSGGIGEFVGAAARETETSSDECIDSLIDEEELTTFREVLEQLVTQGKAAANTLRRWRQCPSRMERTRKTCDDVDRAVASPSRTSHQQELSVMHSDSLPRNGAERSESVSINGSERQQTKVNDWPAKTMLSDDIRNTPIEGRKPETCQGVVPIIQEQQHATGVGNTTMVDAASVFLIDLFAQTATSALRLLFVEGSGFGGGWLRGVGKLLWKVFCCFARNDTLAVLLEVAGVWVTPPNVTVSTLLLQGRESSKKGSDRSIRDSSSICSSGSNSEEDTSGESDHNSTVSCSDSGQGDLKTTLRDVGRAAEVSAAKKRSSKERQKVKEVEGEANFLPVDSAENKGEPRTERNLKSPRRRIGGDEEAEQHNLGRLFGDTEHASLNRAIAKNSQQQKMQQQRRHLHGDTVLGDRETPEKETREERLGEDDDRFSVELDLECTYRALLDDSGDILPGAYKVPVNDVGRRASQRQELRKEKQRQMELRFRAATLLHVYVCAAPRFTSALHVLANLCFILVRACQRAETQPGDDAILAAQWKQFADKISRIVLDACANAAAVIKKSKILTPTASLVKTAAAPAAQEAPSSIHSTATLPVAGTKEVAGTLEAPLLENCEQCCVEGVAASRQRQQIKQQNRVDVFLSKAADISIVVSWCLFFAWRRHLSVCEIHQRPVSVGAREISRTAATKTPVHVAPQLEVCSSNFSFIEGSPPLCNREAPVWSCASPEAAAMHTAAVTSLPPLVVNTFPGECLRGLEKISNNVRVAEYGVPGRQEDAVVTCKCGTSSKTTSSDEERTPNSSVVASQFLGGKSATDMDFFRMELCGNFLTAPNVSKTDSDAGPRVLGNYPEEHSPADYGTENCCFETDANMTMCLCERWRAAELCIARRAAELMEISRRARQLRQKAAATTCQQACLTVLLHLFRVEQQLGLFFYQLLEAPSGCYADHKGSHLLHIQGRSSAHAEVPTRQTTQSQKNDRCSEWMKIRQCRAERPLMLTWPGSAATQLLTAALVGWAQKARSSRQQHLDGLFFHTVADKRAEVFRFVNIIGAALLTDRFFVKRQCLSLAATVVKKQGLCSVSPEGVQAFGECYLRAGDLDKSDTHGRASTAVTDPPSVDTSSRKGYPDCPGCVRRRTEHFLPRVVLSIPFLPWGRNGRETLWTADKNEEEQEVRERENDASGVQASAHAVFSTEKTNSAGRITPKWVETTEEINYTEARPGGDSTDNEPAVGGALYAGREKREHTCPCLSQRSLSTRDATLRKALLGGGSQDDACGVHVIGGEPIMQSMLQQLTQMTVMTLEMESAVRDEPGHTRATCVTKRKELQRELLKTFSVVLQAVARGPWQTLTLRQQHQQQHCGGQSRRSSGEGRRGQSKTIQECNQEQLVFGGAAAGAEPLRGAAQAAYSAVALLQRSSPARQIQHAAARILQLLEKIAARRLSF